MRHVRPDFSKRVTFFDVAQLTTVVEEVKRNTGHLSDPNSTEFCVSYGQNSAHTTYRAKRARFAASPHQLEEAEVCSDRSPLRPNFHGESESWLKRVVG